MKTISLSELFFTKEHAEKLLATGDYILLGINCDGKYLVAYVPYISLNIVG